ncbi:hypothetical protein J7E93_28865 [Streptomyces sp. ISL-36]|uniref:hypothetical protein n=1 Tax=Streptomyces sp. ISL-36 TaxID=2819182 RepID=UPI001BEAAC3D|nr:hypothetical protein [Streptomyces sp. ISL-36]MBT2444034.1 hypothetical protein [Streptomyces sp. ISL-36]
MSDVMPEPDGTGVDPDRTAAEPDRTAAEPVPAGAEPHGDGGGNRAGDAAFEPVAPAPLGVERTPTGHPGVDALLGRLADADRLPAEGHLEVYEDVHRGLRDELTSLDTVRPGPTSPYDHRS